jgi:hypothetical protein
MVDTKSGNNLMYLPLDKLSGGASSSSNSSSSFDPAIATSVEQLRRQNQSTRSGGRDATREGR